MINNFASFNIKIKVGHCVGTQKTLTNGFTIA